MKNARWFVAGLLAVGMGAAASAGILDDAIFHVDFGGDSVDDTHSSGGGLSTGVADPSITFTSLPAMTNSNGRGAVFDGTGGIDYELGAGNELKIEGALTYHVRVKYTGDFSAEEFLMGRFGTTNGASTRVSLLSTSQTAAPDYNDAWGFLSTTGGNNVGHPVNNTIETNVFYDIFFRFDPDPDGAGPALGFIRTTLHETEGRGVDGPQWSTGTTSMFDASDVMFWVGARGDYTSTSPLTGVIDQVNVWTQALTGAEMNEVSGFAPTSAPPPGDALEILDSAILNVNFGGDSVDDVNSNGGGLSTGTADAGAVTFADLPAMPNSNGRGAVFNGTGGIDYGLGAGNELKIERDLTYHVRVKYTGDFSTAEQFLMGRFGTTSGASTRVSLLSTSARSGGGPGTWDDAWGFGSTTGGNNIGNSADNVMATDTFYDIFFRFESDDTQWGSANGFFSTAIWETGNTNQVGASATWWTSTTALFDASDVMFWLGARGDFTSSTSPLTGVIDQANVWTQALTGAEMAIIATEDASLGTPAILEISPVSGSDMVKMVVDAPSAARHYRPEFKTDLVTGTWTNNVAHSTNGVDGFVVTNLGYSATDATGTNEVIYLQSTDAQKFFRIKGE